MQLQLSSPLLVLAAALVSAIPVADSSNQVQFALFISQTDDQPLLDIANKVKAAGGTITVPIGPRNTSEFGYLVDPNGGTEAKSVIDASPPGTFLQYQDVTYEGFNGTAPPSFMESEFSWVLPNETFPWYRAPTGFSLTYINQTTGQWTTS